MPFEPTGVTRTTPPEPPPVFRSEFVGDLFFENERPTDEPADRLFDHRDFQRGCRAILRNITVSSMYALREGLRRDLGVTSSSQIVLWDDEFDAGAAVDP